MNKINVFDAHGKKLTPSRLRTDSALRVLDDLTNQLTVINLCSVRLHSGLKPNDTGSRDDNLRRIGRAAAQATDLTEHLKMLCERSGTESTPRRRSGKPRGNLKLVSAQKT